MRTIKLMLQPKEKIPPWSSLEMTQAIELISCKLATNFHSVLSPPGTLLFLTPLSECCKSLTNTFITLPSRLSILLCILTWYCRSLESKLCARQPYSQWKRQQQNKQIDSALVQPPSTNPNLSKSPGQKSSENTILLTQETIFSSLPNTVFLLFKVLTKPNFFVSQASLISFTFSCHIKSIGCTSLLDKDKPTALMYL